MVDAGEPVPYMERTRQYYRAAPAIVATAERRGEA